MKKIFNKILIASIFFTIILSNTFIFAATKVEKSDTIQKSNTSNSNTYSNTTTTLNQTNTAKTNTPQVDENLKIYDYAELLTTTEEIELHNKVVDFINEHNMDMVIVTINKNNKNSAMEYADDFYDYNNFGIGSKKSGILFLIDMDTRKMWISTTGDAINLYTDARINKILDYTYDKISDKDYEGCVSQFIYYANYFAEKGVGTGSGVEISLIGKIFAVFTPALIATIIMIVIGVNKHKNVKKQQLAKGYINNGSLKITQRDDHFVTTNTTKTKIETSSDSGSSTHIGSSGTSHGGGGRSF